jgi:integrase
VNTETINEFVNARYDWTLATKRTAQWHLGFWAGYNLMDVDIPVFENRTAYMGRCARYNNLWAIKAFLRSLEVTEHPLLKHSVKRKAGPLPFAIRLDQVRILLGECDTSTPVGLRNACLISFLWDTWSRADEVIKAQLEHLRLKDQEIEMALKGGGWGTAVFSRHTRNLLERWIPVRAKIAKPGTRTLFIGIHTGRPLTYGGLRQILVDLGERVGIDVQAHGFRRGAARNHRKNGYSDRDGLDRGRWKSWQMYWLYTRGVKLDKYKEDRWGTDD